MELREAEALCVLDHHQGCIGNVDAHLDDGGGDENLGEARDEVLHDGILLGSGHRTVHEADGEVGQALLKVVAADGRGCEVELVAFLDERTDPVDLAGPAATTLLTTESTRPCGSRSPSWVRRAVRPGGSSSMTETSRSAR